MRKITFLIILLISILKVTYCQQSQPLTDCASLRTIETGNPNVVYHLENDIDCSTFEDFEPIYTNNQPFQGYLDGRNHVIKDLVIKVPPTYTEAGLFPKGYQATVKNVYFHHYTIDSESDHVGALFGQAYNCTVENCHLSSYDDEKLNYIKGKDCVGGWIGNVTNAPYEDDKYTYLYNCTVHNTQIYGKNKVGGHVGICDIKTHVSYCTNRGIEKDKYYNIVNGTSEVGGIIGSCRRCNLTYSGVLKGEVFGYEKEIGALMGYAGMSYFHDLYAKEDVVVTCGSNQGTCSTGGLVGRMNYTNTVEINYYAMYSKAYVRCSGNCGGLYGYIYYNTPSKLNFSECYSSAYLVPTDPAYDTYGNIFGYIDTGDAGTIQYDKVYYNNEYNEYPGSGKVEGTNPPIGQIEPYSCQNLYQQINETYTGQWQGHALGYEYDYSYKEPNCSVRFYQPYSQITTPPVTAAPTEAPYRR